MNVQPSIAHAKKAVRDLMPPSIGAFVNPERLLRLVAICCLVGSGLSAIFIASHPGSQDISYVQAHELVSYFAIEFWIFSLFYIEHRLLRRYMTALLNDRLGYWQCLGSFAFMVAGAAHTLMSIGVGGFPDLMLWATGLFGESVLVLNVIRAYSQDEIAGVMPPPVLRESKSHADNFGWPKSPAKLFAIGAGVLAAGGVLSIVLNFPAMKFPAPFAGQVYFLPYGCLWFLAAAPFAIYARLYKVLMTAYGVEFDQSLNRIHFVVTFIAVFILIKAFMAWQEALASPMAAVYLNPDVVWTTAPFILSAIVFALNAYRSIRLATNNHTLLKKKEPSGRLPRT